MNLLRRIWMFIRDAWTVRAYMKSERTRRLGDGVKIPDMPVNCPRCNGKIVTDSTSGTPTKYQCIGFPTIEDIKTTLAPNWPDKLRANLTAAAEANIRRWSMDSGDPLCGCGHLNSKHRTDPDMTCANPECKCLKFFHRHPYPPCGWSGDLEAFPEGWS